jgi:hypothetical protein
MTAKATSTFNTSPAYYLNLSNGILINTFSKGCPDNLSPTLWTWTTSRSRRAVAEAVAVEVEVVEAVSKATHMVVPHQLLQQRLLAVGVAEVEVVVLGSEEGEERAFERITRRSHLSIIRGSTRRTTRP